MLIPTMNNVVNPAEKESRWAVQVSGEDGEVVGIVPGPEKSKLQGVLLVEGLYDLQRSFTSFSLCLLVSEHSREKCPSLGWLRFLPVFLSFATALLAVDGLQVRELSVDATFSWLYHLFPNQAVMLPVRMLSMWCHHLGTGNCPLYWVYYNWISTCILSQLDLNDRGWCDINYYFDECNRSLLMELARASRNVPIFASIL